MILEYATSNYTKGIQIALGSGVDVDIDWGDGSAIEHVTESGMKAHAYATVDTFLVKISGSLEHYGIDGQSSADGNLVKVHNFGDLGIKSLSYAFWGQNIKEVPEQLPTGVTDLSHMFDNASDFNGDVSKWDVSSVTNMKGMFAATPSFNGDVSAWDVSNVTDMSFMFFASAYHFNADLSNWDVSSVTNMSFMLHGLPELDCDISNWNVSSVTDMSYMFRYNLNFNSDLSAWDVSSVTNMAYMFDNLHNFNSDLSGWDVSNVSNMEWMFKNDSSFNCDLSSWDVSNVTNMEGMLSGATLSTENYDKILNSWTQLTLQNDVAFDAGNSRYTSAAETARENIIQTYNWTITDGGMEDQTSVFPTNSEYLAGIYPNPTSSLVFIDINEVEGDHIQLKVYDMTGKEIKQQLFPSDRSIMFNMSGESSGIYFVHLYANGRKTIKKLIVM